MKKQLIQIANLVICGLSSLLFLFLSIACLFGRSTLDPNNYVKEHILFLNDNVLLNIFSVISLLALLLVINHLFKRLSLKAATVLLLTYVTVAGLIWVCAVQSVPEADSAHIADAASAFAAGDYSLLRSDGSYFRYYPFQMGFTFICEMVFRVFGNDNYVAAGIVNVLFLDAAYLALIKLSGLVFNNVNIQRLTILLLFGCLQPILFCTYIYGNIIGFALSMWAVVFETVYLKYRRKHMLVFAAVLIAAAVMVKPNYYIVLAAMSITLLVDCIKNKSLINIGAVLCAVALSVGLSKSLIKSYEIRADAELQGGVPQLLWAAMGLQESEMAPGWYNHYTVLTFNQYNYNCEMALVKAQADITERLSYFSACPGYTVSFFAKKILSQWNEPSYQSLWVSKVKGHLSPVPDFVEEIYDSDYLLRYLKVFQLLVFIGFLYTMIKNIRRGDCSFAFIPLIILGGFFYHLIFEAKSQYILIYFVMLIPYAAYGLDAIAQKVRRPQNWGQPITEFFPQ